MSHLWQVRIAVLRTCEQTHPSRCAALSDTRSGGACRALKSIARTVGGRPGARTASGRLSVPTPGRHLRCDNFPSRPAPILLPTVEQSETRAHSSLATAVPQHDILDTAGATKSGWKHHFRSNRAVAAAIFDEPAFVPIDRTAADGAPSSISGCG